MQNASNDNFEQWNIFIGHRTSCKRLGVHPIASNSLCTGARAMERQTRV